MRYATAIVTSIVLVAPLLLASAHASGQQFQFQPLHPVDVKPLTEAQEQERLRAQIENWRVYLQTS